MAANITDDVGGHVWKYTLATGTVSSGDLVLAGSTVGVALETLTGPATVPLAVGVEAVLTKKAAANTGWAAGGRVYTIATGGVNKVTGVAVAGKLIGYGIETTTTAATTGKVRLIGGPAPLETQA